MFNDQVSMFNECSKQQWINALNHFGIGHTLNIDYCQLNIDSKGGLL